MPHRAELISVSIMLHQFIDDSAQVLHIAQCACLDLDDIRCDHDGKPELMHMYALAGDRTHLSTNLARCRTAVLIETISYPPCNNHHELTAVK